jgi:hypothetical protein
VGNIFTGALGTFICVLALVALGMMGLGRVDLPLQLKEWISCLCFGAIFTVAAGTFDQYGRKIPSLIAGALAVILIARFTYLFFFVIISR